MPLLPALIAREDERTAELFMDLFVVTTRNRNTRSAYIRAVEQFLSWCEAHNSRLAGIKPYIVVAYIESLLARFRP